MGRRGLVTAREHSRIRAALSHAGVETFRGEASFAAPHTIRVTIPDGSTQDLEAGVVLLATGTRPFHPPQYAFDHARVYDSDSILMLDRVPQSLAVLGGGVAGCEYASIFAALGVRTFIVDSKERLLPWLDAEIALAMQDLFRQGGMELHQQVRATRVEPGEQDVLVTLSDGKRFVAEKVLIAAGRIGNVESLNLPAAGLAAGEKNFLEVNEHFQTKVPHVYAAGDLVGFPGLASTSKEQAVVAMRHACGEPRRRGLSDALPIGIYTIPELSGAGETEETLRKKGLPYVVGRAPLEENARANLIGEAVGFLKIIASPEGKLLGVHCIGAHASELVHLGNAVMSLGGDLRYFITAVFNYPTLGEAYKSAAYDALSGSSLLREKILRDGVPSRSP
jgi:NAD(P) transhydrogenase